MIYVLRPMEPALLSVIDAVMEGPPGKNIEKLRVEFGLQQGPDGNLSTDAFCEFLETRHGFRIHQFAEIDSLIDREAIKNWTAPIVDGPDVKDPPKFQG